MNLFRLISIQLEITCVSFLTRVILLYAVYIFHLITVSLLFCVAISNALSSSVFLTEQGKGFFRYSLL